MFLFLFILFYFLAFVFLKAWNEQHRARAPRKRPECINQLKKKHRRTKLPNTVTIDSIYERNFLSLGGVLEVVIVDAFSLPGTLYLEVYMIVYYCLFYFLKAANQLFFLGMLSCNLISDFFS